MDQLQPITPEFNGYTPSRESFYLKDFSRHPLPGGFSARIAMIRSAAQTIHHLWRTGYELGDFSPWFWRFDRTGTTIKLSVPSTLTIGTAPLSLDQLTKQLAQWRLETIGLVSDAVSRAFMVCFLSREPLGPGRISTYLKEIEELAARRQPAFVQDTLRRYAHRHGASNAFAVYLTDLHLPIQPPPPPATTRSAADWLATALRHGENWYGMCMACHELLGNIERHGFTMTPLPLLQAIRLSQSPENSGPWHLWIDSTTLIPRTRRILRHPTPLPDRLELEIHRLRQTIPAP